MSRLLSLLPDFNVRFSPIRCNIVCSYFDKTLAIWCVCGCFFGSQLIRDACQRVISDFNNAKTTTTTKQSTADGSKSSRSATHADFELALFALNQFIALFPHVRIRIESTMVSYCFVCFFCLTFCRCGRRWISRSLIRAHFCRVRAQSIYLRRHLRQQHRRRRTTQCRSNWFAACDDSCSFCFDSVRSTSKRFLFCVERWLNDNDDAC
jgi:hypothetical protein